MVFTRSMWYGFNTSLRFSTEKKHDWLQFILKNSLKKIKSDLAEG